MQLSKFSDYAFRALIYLANNNEHLITIEFMSKELSISQNHLKKIIHKLTKGGFIQSFKGNKGGIKLAKKAQDINLSEVLLFTESNTSFIECLKENSIQKQNCPYQLDCNLKIVINFARNAFINEFSRFYLTDLIDPNLSRLEKNEITKA